MEATICAHVASAIEILDRRACRDAPRTVCRIGYPTALKARLDESTPLLRKGIIAGKTEDGRLVIDCQFILGTAAVW
jgi:hypothetical protein